MNLNLAILIDKVESTCMFDPLRRRPKSASQIRLYAPGKWLFIALVGKVATSLVYDQRK